MSLVSMVQLPHAGTQPEYYLPPCKSSMARGLLKQQVMLPRTLCSAPARSSPAASWAPIGASKIGRLLGPRNYLGSAQNFDGRISGRRNAAH
jgi:hypothetical protein